MTEANARRRWGWLAIAALVLAWLVPAHDPNWNQNAHAALVRALAEGRAHITVREADAADVLGGGTGDVAVFGGHVYAAKAPGLALWTLPPYLALEGTGIAHESLDMHRTLWLLTIFGAILPATALVLVMRALADRIAPGYGTITATTLGVSTLVLPFASLFFAHVLTAALGFAAFAILWHERRGPPRPALVAGAGVVTGYAVVVELPSLILACVLAGYVLTRPQRRFARALAYFGGAAVGVLPLLVFNELAFGSFTHLSYASAAGGVNQEGLFGVTMPSFHVASALLFSTIGLLRTSPVLALAVVGATFLYRRGDRAEVFVIASLCLAYVAFNAGYETPFGGSSPGPRFLVPLLPFLVFPLALVYERLPVTTIALAAVSAVQMIVITMTNPLAAVSGEWFDQLWGRYVDRTAFGFDDASRRAMPFFALLLLAVAVFTLLATPRPRLARRDVATGALAVGSWLLIASESPALVDAGNERLVVLYVAVAVGALITLAVPRLVFR